MRLALITPFYYPFVRGNAVTVRRLVRSLEEAGCRVGVYALDTRSASDIARQVAADPPYLVHAFHGWHGGRVARAIARENKLPFIITLTGSDVYEALTDIRQEETLAILREAAQLVVFDPCIKERLALACPSLAAKTVIIPQGMELPGGDCGRLGELLRADNAFTFFLPAGLRPVKHVLFPFQPLKQLQQEAPQIRLLLAGPVIDPHYAAQVMGELERLPFAHYIGGIDHNAIGSLYRLADVVLNTSLFEGGMANSILEAMAFGKPVLAADIEGNRSIVRDGVTGFLYTDADDFRQKALLLMKDPQLRKRMGEEAERMVRREFPPEREAAAYLKLYREVTGTG